MEETHKTTLRKYGKSIGFIIPKKLMRKYGIKPNSTLGIHMSNNIIVLTKLNEEKSPQGKITKGWEK